MDISHQQIPTSESPFGSLCGPSGFMQELIAAINDIIAHQPSTVLITGHTGTEKEYIAQGIYSGLFHGKARLVSINCFHLPPHLLVKQLTRTLDELYKEQQQKNREPVTLFLHKINRLPSQVQTRLALLLGSSLERFNSQDKKLCIIATNNTEADISHSSNQLHSDLARLFGKTRLNIPPLTERQEDVPHLVKNITTRYCRRFEKKEISFSTNVMTVLTDYPWQGNTRELKKLLRYLITQYGGRKIRTADLPIHFRSRIGASQPWINLHAEINWATEPVDFRQLVNQFETELIVTAMRKSGGNKMGAARLLNLKRTTLIEKIKKKGIGYLCKK